MKLAVVSPYPPGWRGIGEYGRFVARGIVAFDSSTEVVALAERVVGAPAEEWDGKVRVRRVWRRGGLGTAAVIMRQLARERPDVVWFNVGLSVFGRGAAAFFALSAPALAKAAGLRTVVTLHEVIDAVDVAAIGAPLGCAGRAAAGLATRLLLTADTVCVTLGSYRILLRDRYGRAGVVHVPHGSMAPLPSLPTQPDPGGRTWDLGKGRRDAGQPHFPMQPDTENGGHYASLPGPRSPVLYPAVGGGTRVVMLANQAPHKGLDLLLEAHACLQAQHPGLELVVTGGDHPRFPGYLAEMQRTWGHLPGVTWAGYVDEAELAAAFDTATVIAIPSRATTGTSSVLARAAAHGRAVVAADLPDLREAARDGGLAVRFFPAGSADGLVLALHQVLHDNALRADMETQNLAAAQTYTLDAAVALYLRLFRQLAPLPSESAVLHDDRVAR